MPARPTRPASVARRGRGAGRPYTPEVIRRQVVLEEHDVEPGGRWAVVVRRHVSGQTYASHLWLVPLESRGRARRLTAGPVRDSRPRVRPDGRAIAFRRQASGEGETHPEHGRRLMLLDVDASGRATADAVAITGERTTIGEAEWAPDGRRLAFTAEAGPARFIVGRVNEPRTERAGRASVSPTPTARRIRRVDWRYDESGHLDRWDHLFVVAARPGARPRRLTRGDWGVEGLAWAPDGGSIAFASDPRSGADVRPRTSIWRVPAAGGEPSEALSLGGPVGSPAFSPDGRWLAAVGIVDAAALDDVAPELVVGPADGGSPPRALAPDLDRPIGSWHDTDLNGWMNSGQVRAVWEPDGRSVLALVSDRGRTTPWRYPFDPATGRPSGAPERLVTGGSGDAACWTLHCSADGRVTALAVLGGRAQELYEVAARPGRRALRQRSTIGSDWQRGLVSPVMTRLDAPGEGGAIETWVASPPGAGRRAIPTVVDVHGGPLGAWAPTPSLEVFLLVSAGYRVVLPNIRGSATYGRAWIRPQLGDWGGVDADDVHAALDAVIAEGLADPDRLGILGLSYGGFMVNWLVGTSDRFGAAVSENGVSNQVSAWANSDTGPEYCRTSLLGDPFTPKGIEKLWRQSPLRHVANIRTPLLMLQAEEDRRCPAADNEQLFVALRLLGREVEYVLYPDEYHVYATTGRPDRRIDRMTRMLDWFDRHLRA
jgi:dipeptidyl aminopeptidase/acylaminoacyl peptidase